MNRRFKNLVAAQSHKAGRLSGASVYGGFPKKSAPYDTEIPARHGGGIHGGGST